ncbi:MAG: hypothetical protein H0U57_10540 [Tatlockia sp.]|nr:hypothetical protein [Tatlockia sp.]
MRSICEIKNPLVQYNFAANKHTQKMWINALLHCTKIDINELAMILDLPVYKLRKVYQGELFIHGNEAYRLAQLFLLAFSD